MTENEKRALKAELLLRYQEAEDDLRHLREKAKAIAAKCTEVGQWLDGLGDASSEREHRSRAAQIRTNTDSYKTALDLDQAIQLADEIVTAERNLQELSRRKADLGLR
jgi:hypothetical protein